MVREKTERLEMRVSTSFLATVDEWRRKQPDLPPRAEAIRRLVENALATGSAKAAEGKEFAAAVAGKTIDKAQAHEKPGTGRGKRKRALTEIPADLLGSAKKTK